MDFKVSAEFKLKEQAFDAAFHPKNAVSLIGIATIAGNVHFVEDGHVTTKVKKLHKGSAIRKVTFDPSGRMVTIAKTVKIYDVESKQVLQTLKRNDDKSSTFYSVKPLGHNIVCSGDDDGTVFVWDTRSPEEPIFSASDCDQYISGIDGKYEARRMIACTSGEGTLTAYDLRANRMIEPQSELFECGFQCIRIVDLNKKVVVGGEDGAIYVFNNNEWAHTSGKFAIGDDTRNKGKCSIDGIEMIPDSSIFLAACSDGRMRSFTLWPHEILSETILCRRSPLESIHINPNEDKSEFVVSGGNYVSIVSYQEKDDESSSENSDDGKKLSTPADGSDSDSAKHNDIEQSENATKKIKADKEDYLNVFS